MKSGTIHLIGNAHIDPVWLWHWTEGYQETRATFRAALDRMAEFPQFVFTASQAAIYRWVQEAEPELFQAIREKIQAGRWAVVGGWWMEPDCNLPSGESFARHSLYAQRFFRDSLGIQGPVRAGYCVDSFGHHAMLPQLLKQGGLDYYVFMRPKKTENPHCPEGPFWWESPDGSRVLAFRLLSPYETGPQEIKSEALLAIGDHFDGRVRDLMFFYGVGDHGGGPTIETLRSLEALQKDPELPTLEFSSPERYFERLQASQPDLPVYHGELQYHSVGCYSAHSGVKTWNRKAEHVLLAAERWSTTSQILSRTAPAVAGLASAWQMVLFNQFHDILAGTCIKEAYEDVRDDFGAAIRSARSILNASLQRIASEVDTRGTGADPGEETALMVFNPHAFPAKMPVEQELMTWHMGSGDLRLRDETGNEVPCQAGVLSAVIPTQWRKRVIFMADLPPLGYRVYHVSTAGDEPQSGQVVAVEDGLRIDPVAGPVVNDYPVEADGLEDLVLENEYLRLTLDSRQGDIGSLYDKCLGREVFYGHAAVGEVLDDPSDTWSHGVTGYTEACGRFTGGGLRVLEKGRVRIRVRASARYGTSTLQQDFILYQGQPWIEVRVAINWREHLKLLKLAFPIAVASPVATFEIPYGALVRPGDGKEVPGQRWVDVTGDVEGGTAGLGVVNDAVYSYDVSGARLRMTVLRSPVYAHHTPEQLEPGAQYAWMDQGQHEFRYILLPHGDSWQSAGVHRLAEALNMPALSQAEGIHPGRLPAAGSFLSVDAANVAAVVLKMAEDGRGLVVRLQETIGQQTDTILRIPLIEWEFPVQIGAWQVKTWLVPLKGNALPRETNFLEM